MAWNLHGRDIRKSSDRHQIDEFMAGHRVDLLWIERGNKNRLLLLRREAPRDVRLELLDQHRHAFGAPPPMADGIFDDDLARSAAIVELDRDGIRDRALFGIEIVARKGFVLDADHLLA